ncbi:MAG TPA: hypothetical protein VMY36_00465 [Patescibacteria group bacterium]|nr:hypothetical protein [Patescibacteria group bacterium]
MILKDNSNIKLPSFTGGSFTEMDIHRTGALNNLILEGIEKMENGDLKLVVRTEKTQNKLSDSIKFLKEKRGLKNALHKWLSGQIGKTIDSIYRSEFSFEKDSE